MSLKNYLEALSVPPDDIQLILEKQENVGTGGYNMKIGQIWHQPDRRKSEFFSFKHIPEALGWDGGTEMLLDRVVPVALALLLSHIDPNGEHLHDKRTRHIDFLVGQLERELDAEIEIPTDVTEERLMGRVGEIVRSADFIADLEF